MLKDNFNATERKEFMSLRYMAAHSKAMGETWTKRETITEEEAAELKEINDKMVAITNKLYGRMCAKEQRIIDQRLAKFDVRYVDDYFLQILNRDINNKMQNAVVPRELFRPWCEEIMHVRCKGCLKSCNDCELYDVFDLNLVEEFDGWDLPNCKYAYKEREASGCV